MVEDGSARGAGGARGARAVLGWHGRGRVTRGQAHVRGRVGGRAMVVVVVEGGCGQASGCHVAGRGRADSKQSGGSWRPAGHQADFAAEAGAGRGRGEPAEAPGSFTLSLLPLPSRCSANPSGSGARGGAGRAGGRCAARR